MRTPPPPGGGSSSTPEVAAGPAQVLTPHPKLRDDLVTSRLDTPEGISFVIKDPRTRRFFRLREAEHRIAWQLDGSATLETIREKLDRELNLSIDADALEQFVDQLRRLDLLQSERPAPVERSTIGQRVAGSPLYIRLRAFDPDGLLNRLAPKLSFVFAPGSLVLAAAAFLAALAITIGHWDEILRDLANLYRFDALMLAWVAVLLVTTGHEFAHGLTCKRFGGEVHEMGFLLLYFQPAFYCNISDAWLFPEKSRRLWVTFAGACFDLFVWSAGTLIWWATETDTWVNFVAMILMATTGVRTFFNLNPLIKLDGYYLLTDYLDVPNLRQRSVGYLNGTIRQLFGARADGRGATARERRIFLTYGAVAAVYSCWLLGWVALWFGSYLVTHYQGWGFLAFAGALVMAFKNPLDRAAAGLSNSFRRARGEGFRLRRPPGRAVVLALAAVALFLIRLDLTVGGEFTVLPVRNADVRAAVDGTIEDVCVDEGVRVRVGDVLLRLSARDYQAELGQVEAEIAEKQAMLKMLRAGPRDEEIRLARDEVQTARMRHEHARKGVEEAERIRATRLAGAEATVRAAEDRLRYTRNDSNRYSELFRQGLLSRQQLDESERELAVREKEFEVAQAELQALSADGLAESRKELALAEGQRQETTARLQLLLAGARPEVIEATEAGIARLLGRRQHLEERVRLTTVVSPAAGVVTTPKLREKLGERVREGDLILKVYELDTVTPEITVPEKEIADVAPGQRVVLKARAYPDRSFAATVKAIAPVAIEDSGLRRQVFRVTIAMNEPADLLKPQMTGQAKIFCGRRPLLQLWTRRLARYLRVEFWSWW